MIKAKGIREVGHVAFMGGTINSYILIGNHQGVRLL
jgi:hypothetical protein